MEYFNCPLCMKLHKTLPRYKLAICWDCIKGHGTKDKNGNDKIFYNIDIFGGLQAFCRGQTITDDFSCYVNGILCKAEEGRFGGIVILPDLANLPNQHIH